MILNFKNWLMKETGTSTASVAHFARPITGVVRRNQVNLEPITFEKKRKKKKKKKSH